MVNFQAIQSHSVYLVLNTTFSSVLGMGSSLSSEEESSDCKLNLVVERTHIQEWKMRPVDEPCAFRQLRMSKELLEWIISGEDLYCYDEGEILDAGSKWAFSRAVDHKQLPGHVYYEGYAHALGTSEPIDSMNPRWGNAMEKNQGPSRAVAFVRCLKQINSEWIANAFLPDGNDSANFFGQHVIHDHHLSASNAVSLGR